MHNTTWDVIIIGGGSAGLSAAIMLGRSRRRVLVLDGGAPRNRFAPHMHGVLGRDGWSPLDLLATGRDEVERYGVVIESADVTDAALGADGFEIRLDDGERHLGRRLLVTTGVRDQLPEIPGLVEQWGTGAVVCPYCDGWEVRDRRIAVLASGPTSVHQAQLLRQLSSDVTYLVNGSELPADAYAALVARGIGVEVREVTRVLADENGVISGIRLADCTEVAVDSLFVAPATGSERCRVAPPRRVDRRADGHRLGHGRRRRAHERARALGRRQRRVTPHLGAHGRRSRQPRGRGDQRRPGRGGHQGRARHRGVSRRYWRQLRRG